MDKVVREYIKKKINDDDYVCVTNGKDVIASIGVCRASLGDVYTVDVVRDGFCGRTYEYDSLSQCFATLSRLEREKDYYWEVCTNT